MKLSILICTVHGRELSYEKLKEELETQIAIYNLVGEVEIISHKDNREITVGAKRNLLKREGTGNYICFIDDDDMVSRNYLKVIFDAIQSDVDIITFNVQKYLNGEVDKIYCPNVYIGSLVSGNYCFMNNLLHLCPHKRIFSDKIEFPEKNFGEDFEYSLSLIKLLPTEKRIEDVLYNYYFSSSETLTQK